jgi:tRNA pseudouridine55 synthase
VPIRTPFGFINAFKPPGPSSASFGNWVKQLAGGAPVGHWGTLDPTACGVLVLAVGKATKLLPLLPHARKQYVFELVVGVSTDSGDATGAVIATSPVPAQWARALDDVAASLVGPHTQIPPMHSAVKVDGRPLYRAARLGLDVPRTPRPTVIHSLRAIAHEGATARLFVECDAGTYVRVLCEEIGRRLGVPARMGALLRVASGPFVIRDSVRPDQIGHDLAGCLIDPLVVLAHPRVELDAMETRRFAHGNEIRLTTVSQIEGGAGDVLVTSRGTFLGCGRLIVRDGTQLLAPTHVFAHAEAVAESQGSQPGEANG